MRKQSLFFFLATFVVGMLCSGGVSNAAFSDVDVSHVHSDAINFVESEGIAGGFSD